MDCKRRLNQSILKEISPDYSLEGLMLKLKLQYFGHLIEELTHWKRPWCWERLKVGGKGDDRGWDRWMVSLTWWTWVWVNSRNWWWRGKPGLLQSLGSQRVRHCLVTELNWIKIILFSVYRIDEINTDIKHILLVRKLKLKEVKFVFPGLHSHSQWHGNDSKSSVSDFIAWIYYHTTLPI